MKHHPAWLAIGLLVFVVLACNLGKKTTNTNFNSNANSNSQAHTEVDLGSGVAIKEVHMANDDGDGKPGVETDSFESSDRTIHCVATLKAPKSGTKLRFEWWAVDIPGAQNKMLEEIIYTTKGRENVIHGHLTYRQDWVPGRYKVQVYVNGDLDKTAFYTVR